VYNNLGFGFLERLYIMALERELRHEALLATQADKNNVTEESHTDSPCVILTLSGY